MADAQLLEGEVQKIVIVERESNSKRVRPVLNVVDVLLAIFVVSPLVVFCWRGSWGFMDIHGKYFPLLPSFLIGMFVHILLAVIQDNLHSAIVESEKHWSLKIVSHFLRRLYTYLFLTMTILHWRGGWGLIDYSMNVQFTDNFVAKKDGIHWFLTIWAACFATLVATKSLRNSIAPPFAICVDKGDYVFRFPTMFNRKDKPNVYLSILDCMFSVGITGNLVVTFWRGLWIIVDITLLPDNYVSSAWASLILGLFLVGLVFRLQNFVKNLCANCRGIPKIAVADLYIILSCVATIMYWRGAWYLTYIYFIPSNVELSCILSHLIGFMFLLILGCSNSMLVRGVYKDGKEPNGDCVVFPCQYLRIILQQEDEEEELEPDDVQIKIKNTPSNIIY